MFERLGLAADARLAAGVDQLDYTKGIPGRLHAVERLLEKRPEWIGRFSFVHLLAAHHEHDALNELFRAADICVVTSLHDGMNGWNKKVVHNKQDA